MFTSPSSCLGMLASLNTSQMKLFDALCPGVMFNHKETQERKIQIEMRKCIAFGAQTLMSTYFLDQFLSLSFHMFLTFPEA